MSNFGRKNRSEWNAEDNAANAMSAMLGAELRNKRIAHDNLRARSMAVIAGLTLAAVYLLAAHVFGF